MYKMTDSVLSIKGIGTKTGGHLSRIGIYSVADFLRHYPRDYRAYPPPLEISDRSMDDREPAAYRVHISQKAQPVSGGKKAVTLLRLSGGDPAVSAIWYHSPFIAKRLLPGKDFILYGNMVLKGKRRSLEHPDIFSPGEYEAVSRGLQPVYALTEGLSQNFFRKTMHLLLEEVELTQDILPALVRSRHQLAEYNFALRQIHFPDHRQNLAAARNRLVFEEFFLFSLQMRRLKTEHQSAANAFPVSDFTKTEAFIGSLPYQLTGAQLRVWQEIAKDLGGAHAMNRLVQGDVGSGKTAVAALAMLSMARAGHQAAMMAPTEVLAVQHYKTLSRQFAPCGLRCVLLTGSMTAAQKKKAYDQMESGEADIIIGTQALFQEKAVYADLGLIVTDEQHRFGVAQRERLAGKSEGQRQPHVLVMSATPIPRTLAIILYGDLDISVLDEKPQNRLPVKTAVVGTSYRPNAWRFMEKEIRAGRQAYIICPMVEESGQIDAENVTDYADHLRSDMPGDIRIDLVHGRMKSEDKNRVMQRFAGHETDILVSTTVIEVGVDVPNASVILIENAERFGLAQLHQLRGRVGRGDCQSYCIFMYGQDTPAIRERLDILRESRDGFAIAEHDLRLRGPGDLFGTMQSGALVFAIGDVFADSAMLVAAGEAAGRILESDPDLKQPGHLALLGRLKALQPDENQIVL